MHDKQGGEGESEQSQSKGLLQSQFNLLWIQPGACEGFADKANRTTHSILLKQSRQLAGEPGQGIEQVRQAHEVVIAHHGIPVFGKEMFVGVPLVFLHQESGFDAPAVACAQVTAGMDV